MDVLDFTFLQEDALVYLRSLPSASINLVITSPPYNIGKSYESVTQLDAYLDTISPIIHELYRVLTEDGSVCWEVGNCIGGGTIKEVFPLDIYFYPLFKHEGFLLRNRIIWHFGHGLHCQHRFSGRYESILWFSKSDSYYFNLDAVRVPSKYPGKRSFRGAHKGLLSGNPLGKNPSDFWDLTMERLSKDWDTLLWDIPNVKSNHPEKTSHPCQFPVELAERCVLALSREGDTVYDPFAGVGSTLLAALKNGRRAVGTDLCADYVSIGLERIAALRHDVLKTRPLYAVTHRPSRDAAARYPREWLELRLSGIAEEMTKLTTEAESIKELLR